MYVRYPFALLSNMDTGHCGVQLHTNPVLHGRLGWAHYALQQPAFEQELRGMEVSRHGQIQSRRVNTRVSQMLGCISF
jgi:hypothetical protein